MPRMTTKNQRVKRDRHIEDSMLMDETVFSMPEDLIREGNELADTINDWVKECHSRGYATYVQQSQPFSGSHCGEVQLSFTIHCGTPKLKRRVND